MNESLFQQATANGVSQVLAWLALLGCGVSVACLIALAVARRRSWKWAGAAALPAALSLVLALGWEFVVSRTTFHRRLYGNAAERQMLDGVSPPAERYEAREQSRYSPSDGMLREGLPAETHEAPTGPLWLPPDRLDSVSNLALLGVVFALGGLALGLLAGWVLRRTRPAAADGGGEA